MLTRNVKNSQESFVTPTIKGTWRLNFLELLFLRKISQQVLYAPEFPRKGLTSGAAWMVVRSKSRLLGWQGQKEPAATKRCDTSWRSCSTECRLGSKSRLTVVGFIRPDDLALAYRRLKSFLALSPSEGDHELATIRGPFRVRIWKGGASVDHTLSVSRSWRNLYREGHEVQILRKLKAEGSKLTRRYAAIIVFDADLEYFSDEFASILDQNYRTVFTNRPYVSCILLKKHVTGEPARLFFGNRFGGHPLRPREIEMLVSSEKSGEQQGSNPQVK